MVIYNQMTRHHFHALGKDAYVICLSGSIVIKDQFEEKVITRGGISTMKKGTFHQISADLANSMLELKFQVIEIIS